MSATRDARVAVRHLIPLWRRLFTALVFPAIGVCVAVAMSPRLAGGVWTAVHSLHGIRAYQSRAVLEWVPRGFPQTSEERGTLAAWIPSIRSGMLSWSYVREVIFSGKVDFERQVDPDDRSSLDGLYDDVRRHIQIRPLGLRHVEVTCRSRRPEWNATLVNELVKQFVVQRRKDALSRAKVDEAYFREKLSAARARLDESSRELLELRAATPWFTGDVRDIALELEKATSKHEELDEELEAHRSLLRTLRSELRSPPSIVQGDLLSEIDEAEKVASGLAEQQRACTKRVALLYERLKKTPKLLAARNRLDEQTTDCRKIVDELRESHVAAKRELDRLSASAYGYGYKVSEYARPDSSPIQPDDAEVVDLQHGILVAAAFIFLATLPIWFTVLFPFAHRQVGET